MEFLQALAAGGDVATIALVFCLWKFDRRLVAVETRLQMLPEMVKD